MSVSFKAAVSGFVSSLRAYRATGVTAVTRNWASLITSTKLVERSECQVFTNDWPGVCFFYVSRICFFGAMERSTSFRCTSPALRWSRSSSSRWGAARCRKRPPPHRKSHRHTAAGDVGPKRWKELRQKSSESHMFLVEKRVPHECTRKNLSPIKKECISDLYLIVYDNRS